MSEQDKTLILQRVSDIPQADVPRVLEEVVKVEKETWPEEIQAPLEKFVSRAEVFPEGFLLISSSNLGLVGVSTAEIIDYSPEAPPTSWEETTDNGWISGVHKKDGNALYLVSVGVSPRSQNQGVGTTLVTEQIELARRLGLHYLVLGSRLPGYTEFHKQHPNVSAKEYAAMEDEASSSPLDPEIRFYVRCGLKPVQVVPNYMENDPQSENFGVVMVWENKE